MCTSLNPLIGYEQAAKLAKEAFATGQTIRELCREKGILPEETLSEALDPVEHDRAAGLIHDWHIGRVKPRTRYTFALVLT